MTCGNRLASALLVSASPMPALFARSADPQLQDVAEPGALECARDELLQQHGCCTGIPD